MVIDGVSKVLVALHDSTKNYLPIFFVRNYLLVQVTPGTISANSGVMPGDLIISINGVHTGMMKHKDAQQTIVSCGNNITLGLSRYILLYNH